MEANRAFYGGVRRIDVLGCSVTVDEFHALFFDDAATLEKCHCYVQWLFPIDAHSEFNRDSSPLSHSEARYIAHTVVPNARLMYSFRLMLRFYGFVLRDGAVDVDHTLCESRLSHLNHSPHNWLRVTRILRCLSLCGMNETAREWLRALRTEVFETRRLDKAASSYRSFWGDAASVASDAWPTKNVSQLMHRAVLEARAPSVFKVLANAYIAQSTCASLAHVLRHVARCDRSPIAIVLGLATSKKFFCLVPKRAAVFVLNLSTMRLRIVQIAAIRVECVPRSDADVREWSFHAKNAQTGLDLYSLLRRSSPLGGEDFLPCGVRVIPELQPSSAIEN